jgi:GldM C-terminal domain
MMSKKLMVTIFLFGLIPAIAYAQVAVQADKMNIFYIGIPNPITIAVSDAKFREISVSIDYGKVTPDPKKGKGHYIVEVFEPGTTNITVSAKTAKGIKPIAKQIYRIKRLPVKTTLCSRESGRITVKMLLSTDGPKVAIDGANMEGFLHIDSFTVRVERDDEELYRMHHVHTDKFDEETRRFFKKLKAGDKLFIEHIICLDINGQSRLVWPTQFNIITEEDWKHLYE